MEEIFVQCPKCGSNFDCLVYHNGRPYKRKFCSRKCANSRVWNKEKKARHSVLAKQHPNYVPAKLENRICPCGKEFCVRPFKKNKHCSHTCAMRYRPQEVKKKCGGYREKAGRSKSGYYKGVYCGSTYELCWVIYQIDKGMPFKRFEGFIEKNGLKYYPDFLVGERVIIEIKGYWTEVVDQKTKMAKSLGYCVEVLYKQDLKEIFQYVENTYGTKKFQTLYDDHKPNYVGICLHCKKEFSNERRKPKTKEVFCSRVCCGKYRKNKNTPCR